MREWTPERRRAHAAYEARRRRLIAYGRWNPRTDADLVRPHVRSLMESGLSWRKVAELADVPEATVGRLLYGKAGKPPSDWVKTASATAILNVKASLSDLSPRALVDATGTHRRLQALIALGWSRTKLAQEMASGSNTIGRVLDRPRVYASTAAEVRDLYDRLWDVSPPIRHKWDRSAAEAARREAARNRWPVPMQWDDETIDDPDARPAAPNRSAHDVDSFAVDLALGGEEVRLAAAEVAEVVRIGTERGMSARRLAEITGRTDRTVQRRRSA
jgi:hypothetical protein